MDAKGEVRAVMGGYSPKVFDGHAVEMVKDWFDTMLEGAVIVGDQHFAWASKHLKKVKIYSPIKKPKQTKKKKNQGDLQDATVLTKRQQSFNDALAQLRARMEQPFGWLKGKFKSLELPWGESLDQMDCTVRFGLAVWTRMKQNRN
jgi:hypothetical protein